MCSVLQNFYQDIHDIAHTEGTSTKVVHDRAEVFDIKTEALFRYLQVCAICNTLLQYSECWCLTLFRQQLYFGLLLSSGANLLVMAWHTHRAC